MEVKTLLNEQIERERTFMQDQAVGSEEYNNSLKRLVTLEEKLFELEKFEFESVKEKERAQAEKKSEKIKNGIEICKIAVGVLTSFGGLALIEMYQKEDTFTGVMKSWLNVFMPKKM